MVRRLAAAVLLLTVSACLRREKLPLFGRLPGFSLVDQSGHPVTLAGLQGKIWVADFIFTRCGGACPAMTARMAFGSAARLTIASLMGVSTGPGQTQLTRMLSLTCSMAKAS